jgi:putative ABC transport system permease protein
MSTSTWFDGLRGDARLAFRALGRNPAFTATVTLSLALAIGASASAFSVVDAVRFRALPFPDAERLVLIAEAPARQSGSGGSPASLCRASCTIQFTTWQNAVGRVPLRTLSAVGAHVAGGKSLNLNGESEFVTGSLVTDSIFSMLRATPALGRSFIAEDHKLGATPVTILSHELWTNRFGQSRDVLGTVVQLSDTRYTIVGVMPPGFDFESRAAFWLPAVPALDPSTRPSIRSVSVIGRLAPGTTIEQARAEIAALSLATDTRTAGPAGAASERMELTVLPLRVRYEAATQNNDIIFFGVVLSVVLIACANLTNLLLTRGLDQRREFAVRAALGAEPSRLARHMIVQNALLAAVGTAVGLLFARAFLGVVQSLSVLNTFRPTGMDYRIDWRVAVFAAVLAGVAAVVMSVIPVRIVLATRAQDALRENASTQLAGESGSRLQRMFVSAQLAFAVALLISAGLTVRTVLRLSRVDLGFAADNLVQLTPSFPHDWRVKDKYVPATARVEDALRAMPGAAATATRAAIPLGSSRAPAELTIEGGSAPLPRDLSPNVVLAVDSGYFKTIGVPIVSGRAFTADDREAAMPVAIVNQWAASRWWQGRNPVGSRVRIDTLPGQSVTVTIVGVARDNKAGQGSLMFAKDGPELYRPILQSPSAFPTFFVRTAGPTAAVLRPARAALTQLVLGRPVGSSIVSESAARQLEGVRATSRQIVSFAVVGLLLALVGVYGALSYSVNRRVRELGIRRALGASPNAVYGLVVRDALYLTLPGTVLGVVGALMIGKLVAPLLYGTPSNDPLTFVAIVLVVLITAVVSALVPARRAARVSPLVVLKG